MTALKSASSPFILMALIALCALPACFGIGRGGPPPVAPIAGPACEQPLLELVPEPGRAARQTFGQITITANPVMPECERWTRVTGERKELFNLMGPNRNVIEITEREYLRVGSTFDIEFTITNQDPNRVFRPGGAVWEVLVDDNMVGVDDAGNSDNLVNLAIPPGRTRNLSVEGIAYPSLADEGTSFSFGLYDVIIQQDETGQVTQRETYMWTYTLRYRTVDQPPTNRAAKCQVEELLATRLPDLPADLPSADYDAFCLGIG